MDFAKEAISARPKQVCCSGSANRDLGCVGVRLQIGMILSSAEQRGLSC